MAEPTSCQRCQPARYCASKRRTHHDRIGVDSTLHALDVDLARLRVDLDRVDLDTHVRCALVERRMRSDRDNANERPVLEFSTEGRGYQTQ